MTSVPSQVVKFYEDRLVSAGSSIYPNTDGHTKLLLRDASSWLQLSNDADLVHVMTTLKRIAGVIQKTYNVQRCAFVTDGGKVLSIIPLHGLSKEWHPITSEDKVFFPTYPGYITSQDGPEMSHEALAATCAKIQKVSGIQQPFDYTFHGAAEDQNLFARVVRGELSQYRVWEDSEHVAMLTPFGNTTGFTVLVPRKHLSSDILSLDESEYTKLILAAKQVAMAITAALGAERCGMIFEGFEIDYAHVKLIPVHAGDKLTSTELGNGAPKVGDYHEQYVGHVTSKDGPWTADLQSIETAAAHIGRHMNSPD